MVEKSDGHNITLREIKSPPQIVESDKILAAVVFSSENIVSVTWMNRVQNQSYIHLYDVQESVYKTVHNTYFFETEISNSFMYFQYILIDLFLK